MANTTAVYARIDTGLKENAESILTKLGITPSSAIQMLYSQIVLCGGIPFELKLPTVSGNMTRHQLDVEIAKGIESANAGETITSDDVDTLLNRKYGI